MMRRLLLGAASALALASSAQAANLTPDQLTAATTISNTDLIMVYPSGGPMKAAQWSVFKSQMQAALGTTYLQVSNNLSDLASPSSARTSLGLGTAATQGTGTTGAVIPLLSNANTWSGKQSFLASAAGSAGVNLGVGVAPTSPINGDEWITAGGFYAQVGGSTIQMQPYLGFTPANASGQTFTGPIGASSLTVNGAASTVRPIYYNTAGVTRWVTGASSDAEGGANSGSNFQIERFSDAGAGIDYPLTINRATGLMTLLDGLTVYGGITGNASTATALATPQTIQLAGDVGGSAFFNGTATASISTVLGTVNGNVGAFGSATAVPTITVNGKGLVLAASQTAIPTASTSTAGLAPLATGAQVIAGTDTTHAVTPASLTSQSAPASGYSTLPGGMIVEGGVSGSVLASGGTLTVTYPQAYTTATTSVVVTPTTNPGGTPAYSVTATSSTGFTITNNSTGNLSFRWISIGY